MKLALLLMLSVTFNPSWSPSQGVDPKTVNQFVKMVYALPDQLKPISQQDVNCLWARALMALAASDLKTTAPSTQQAADLRELYEEARVYHRDHCGGPGGLEREAREQQTGAFWANRYGVHWPIPSARASEMPFPLPPLPDRGGGDLGPTIWAMFQTMESRLSSGGIHLEGEGRACAWASGVFAAADATVRAELGTPGIASAVPVLQKQVGTYCRGQALAQKDAAWAWLREHRATQPLEVAARPATSPWPAPRPGDVAAWLTAALLVYAPEAWPILVAP